MLDADDTEISKRLHRGPRKLSLFMAQEMLYDYSQGRLDDDRREALELELETNPELKFELDSIVSAEKYAKHLAQTKISAIHIEELKTIRPLNEVILSRLHWRNWPDLMKWSAEAFAVSLIVAAIASFLPWEKLQFNNPVPKTEVSLAEIKTAPPTTDVMPQAARPVEPQAEPHTAPIKTPPTDSAVVPRVEPEIKPANKVLPLKGLLINFMMSVEPSPAIANEIRDKITAAGGVKAGQVELGWRKSNPNGNYYHFTMPEGNYQELISSLNQYGVLRIYKNPHERVMPEGKLRIILWIEDKSTEPQTTQPTQEQ